MSLSEVDSSPLTVSVIIPAYNQQDTIAATISSAYRLTGACLDVIVINDGSSDRTASVLEEQMAIYPDLRVFHQPNGGLSAARNRGLQEAQGSYIIFLDAGDQLLAQDISPLLTQADMHAFGVIELGVDSSTTEHRESTFHGSGLAYLKARIEQYRFSPVAWKYIYSTSFLRRSSLAFAEGLLHEDNLFSVQALAKASEVRGSDILLYSYIRTEGSITTKTSLRHIQRRLGAYETIVRRLTRLLFLHPNTGIDLYLIGLLRYSNRVALGTSSKRLLPGVVRRRAKILALRIVSRLCRERHGRQGAHGVCRGSSQQKS